MLLQIIFSKTSMLKVIIIHSGIQKQVFNVLLCQADLVSSLHI